MSQIFDSFIDFMQNILPAPPDGLNVMSAAACNWCHMCDKPGGLCVLWWLVILLLGLFLITSLIGKRQVCPHCKAKNSSKASVCKKCGESLEEESEPLDGSDQEQEAASEDNNTAEPAPTLDSEDPALANQASEQTEPLPPPSPVQQPACTADPGMRPLLPGTDPCPQQAPAPAQGIEQSRREALERLLQKEPALANDLISLLLQAQAPNPAPAPAQSQERKAPAPQPQMGNELAALRASIKYCPVCGTVLPLNAVFCGTCGERLSE